MSRGMYWDDLKALIRRNQTPNADVTFYQDPDINADKIGVFDRKKLQRSPGMMMETGYLEEDHWRDSHVCEAAWFDGMIPMESSQGYYDSETSKFVDKPYQGALGVLEMLAREGSIDRRSDELRRLFREHGRVYPPPS